MTKSSKTDSERNITNQVQLDNGSNRTREVPPNFQSMKTKTNQLYNGHQDSQTPMYSMVTESVSRVPSEWQLKTLSHKDTCLPSLTTTRTWV